MSVIKPTGNFSESVGNWMQHITDRVNSMDSMKAEKWRFLHSELQDITLTSDATRDEKILAEGINRVLKMLRKVND